jgi:hypothetical protein
MTDQVDFGRKDFHCLYLLGVANSEEGIMKKGKWAALFIGTGLGSVFLGSFALLLSVVEGIPNCSTFPDHDYAGCFILCTSGCRVSDICSVAGDS